MPPKAKAKAGTGKPPAKKVSEPAKKVSEAELKRAFEIFDSDKDGCVSKDELKAVLMRAGPGLTPLSEEKVDSLFTTLDTNSDGHLSVDEISQGWSKLMVGDTEAALKATEADIAAGKAKWDQLVSDGKPARPPRQSPLGLLAAFPSRSPPALRG